MFFDKEVVKIGFALLFILVYGTFSELYLERGTLAATINTPFESFWFVMQTITTVGYGDTVPVTVLGKINAMLIMVLGIGVLGLFVASMAKWMVTDVVLKKSGYKRTKMKSHVVICNEGVKAHSLIDHLSADGIYRLVLLSVLESQPSPKAEYIKGSCMNQEDLERANISCAKTVVILADILTNPDESPEAVDAKSILGIMNVRKLNTDAHVLVELLKHESIANAMDSGADEVVLGETLTTNLLVKGTLHPGTVPLFNIVLSPEYAEGIYEARLPGWANGRSYREIMDYMLNMNVTPIALRNQKGLKINPKMSAKIDHSSILYLGDHEITFGKNPWHPNGKG